MPQGVSGKVRPHAASVCCAQVRARHGHLGCVGTDSRLVDLGVLHARTALLELAGVRPCTPGRRERAPGRMLRIHPTTLHWNLGAQAGARLSHAQAWFAGQPPAGQWRRPRISRPRAGCALHAWALAVLPRSSYAASHTRRHSQLSRDLSLASPPPWMSCSRGSPRRVVTAPAGVPQRSGLLEHT